MAMIRISDKVMALMREIKTKEVEMSQVEADTSKRNYEN